MIFLLRNEIVLVKFVDIVNHPLTSLRNIECVTLFVM